MKTTLNVADSAMQRLREEAAQRGTTMSALAETGARRVLAEPSQYVLKALIFGVLRSSRFSTRWTSGDSSDGHKPGAQKAH